MDVVIKKDRVAPMLVVRLAARYICSLDGHGVEYHPVSHSPFHIYWLFPCLVFQQDAVCCNSCCISDRFNLSVTNRLEALNKNWISDRFFFIGIAVFTMAMLHINASLFFQGFKGKEPEIYQTQPF